MPLLILISIWVYVSRMEAWITLVFRYLFSAVQGSYYVLKSVGTRSVTLFHSVFGAMGSFFHSSVNRTSDNLALNTTTPRDILCTSSLTICLASWLHISCASANPSTPPCVVDAFNGTALEIGHWASISASPKPLVNTF